MAGIPIWAYCNVYLQAGQTITVATSGLGNSCGGFPYVGLWLSAPVWNYVASDYQVSGPSSYCSKFTYTATQSDTYVIHEGCSPIQWCQFTPAYFITGP